MNHIKLQSHIYLELQQYINNILCKVIWRGVWARGRGGGGGGGSGHSSLQPLSAASKCHSCTDSWQRKVKEL